MTTPNVLAFEPDGRPIEFVVWLDDLQLFLLTDAKEGVSPFDYVCGTAVAPTADAPPLERSQWQTRDAAACLAIRNHLPITERAHFSQHKTAKTLYDAVVARYSSPATAAIGRLMLPYLFPDLSSFTTAEDLISHLRATDTRFRATLSAEVLLVALLALPSLRGAPPPLSPSSTPLQLLLTTTLVLRRSELLPLLVGSVAAAGAAGVARAVGVAVEVAVVQVAGEVEVVGVVMGVEAVEVVVGAAEALGAVDGAAAAVGEGGGSGGGSGGQGQQQLQQQQQQQQHQRQRQTPTSQQLLDWYAGRGASRGSGRCPYIIRTGPRAGRQCTGFHTEQRCFPRLSDTWRAKFPDAPEFPNWADLLRRDVPIFDLDYEAIFAAMYALSVSAEGDCYLCVPPDPGIAPGIAPAALGACDTTVTPLPAPVPVSLADPSGGPVLARYSTVLPCPAVPSGELSGLHLPSFSTNLLHSSTQVATQCECHRLSHDTLLWHHRLGHPSLPRLRSMHSRFLVSGLPWSLPALPPSPAPPCIPCVEGRQRAASHSSFPPTEAPLQTLHLDVWGPARIRGQGHERYFLLVVDDYTHYTTVFPLQRKGDVLAVLIPWIHAARLQLREQFQSDFPVLHLHSDPGGEFSSYLLVAFCAEHGIRQTFTLPASPQQNGVAERRIGLVMEATPLSTRHSLSALPSDESVESSGPYPELVGCLMYLMTCTRPDLAYPLSILARYVAPGRHRPEHMAATKRVLRYLCSTSGLGLVLGGRSLVVLTDHADASWVDDLATQRSSQGYTFSLGSGCVSWRSTCSSFVLSSSCEAEIYAAAMAAQELRWLTYLLTDLGEPPRSPPVLYVDNKAMLALCREHRLEHRTKHIALRYFLARELQQRGQLRLAYVASEANTAAIFTKALAPCDHQHFCTLLGQEGRGAGGGRGRGRGGRGSRGGGAASMKSAGNEIESRDDRFPGQFFFVSTQAPAGPEKDEDLEEPAAVEKVTLHSLDYWVIDSGATYSMTPRADLLTEVEPSPVKHVTSALGQRAEVKGMGKAMFKGADGKMVGLKNVLWVPNLAANVISVWRLQKDGMDTSSKGAKTYTARLGERILWDLHKDRDVYNEMWQIPVVPMPKQRQVAEIISTKGEAVGSGDGANGGAKEIKSKKCNLGGTSKLGEHEESGAVAKKQHKDEENPMAAVEEEYGESMWGTIASAAFSNPTSATGECDWLILHRRMGHVALPILQQLVKNEMFAGIRVKGEPDELGAAGAEYFLTIVDVYTRMTWVYVLSKKSDVAETVKTDWLPMVERQQDRLVKAIRTDRGGEILSKEFSLWLKKNGIRHSLTMPYSPEMNGITERANRTITETARGLLIEAGLPEYFWPDVVRSACVAKNRALIHVGADKWAPYVEWIGRKPKVDMLRVFGCMCMALVPKHLRHNKLGAKAIWAVHLGMAQNSKGWLLWDPFTKKFLVSRDCKFMENLMYKDWKAENEAKIGMRFGEVKSSGLEHVELPLELSSGSTTTRQSSLVNGGEEAKDAEEEEEEVQRVSESAPTLPSRTTSAPRIRVTPQQRHESLHVPGAEEKGRGKRRIQAPNRLTLKALGKPAKSALAGAALIVGDDEESDYHECAFAFYSLVEMLGEPATLKEALESSDAKDWKKEMEFELLFKIKSDADGKIERYKSRLVAKGYQKKEKVDYKELFAHVLKTTTLRTLLAGAAIKGWVVKQMDVTTAFLNGVLEEEIFMAQPEGFDDGSGRVLMLKKALYGLKQAPRQWYLNLRGVLEEIGFTPSTADHSLFMLGEGEQRSFMAVYVDDLLIFSPSSDLVKEVMLKLHDKFKCRALGDVNFYLGLHIEHDVEKRCMRVHQRKYLEALAPKLGQSEGHVATPFPSGFKCVKGLEEERRCFHSLVGSLMYAAVNTRPDIAFATGQLARVVQCPNEEQVAAGMRVANYLGQTPTVGLQYSVAAQRRQKGADGVEPGHLFLTAFSDATYASEPNDMTTAGGFICCVCGGPTAWESKKHVDQASSSVESEYMGIFRAVREIVWQRRLLAELGEEQQGPTPLYCDSQGAIALAKNPVARATN
ncbi:unnamed protein product [Closterium sp. NIES-53]